MALVPDGNASVASQVFAAWATNLNLSSAEVGCPSSGGAGGDWEQCFNISKSSKSLQLALSNPSLSYHWTKFQHDYGLRAWGAATKTIKENMPDASVGANFSPGMRSNTLSESFRQYFCSHGCPGASVVCSRQPHITWCCNKYRFLRH